MGLAVHSASSSYASFEAELEGAILRHTASVDAFLQSASSWAPCGDAVTPALLQALFLSDLGSGLWQSYACSQGEISMFEDAPLLALSNLAPVGPSAAAAGALDAQRVRRSSKRRPRLQPLQASRMERFLQDDMQRCAHLQPDSADACGDALALAAAARHSCPSSGSGSLVRLPEPEPADVAWEPALPAVAPLAAAAAAALAAVHDAAGTPAAQPLCSRQQAPWSLAAAAAACEQQRAAASAQQQQQPPLAMEADEDVAALKQAARARLAELQASASSGAGASEAAAAASKAADDAALRKGLAGSAGLGSALPEGSVHSSRVPERPRVPAVAAAAYAGLGDWGEPARAALARKQGSAASFGSNKGDWLSCSTGGAWLDGIRQCRFSQLMAAGLALCICLLPLAWAGQSPWGAGLAASLPAWVRPTLALWCARLHVPAAAAVLLYCLATALLLRRPLLHFASAELEARYVLWSNQGKVVVDCAFQLLFMGIGLCLWARLKADAGSNGWDDRLARHLLALLGAAGSGAPLALLLMLRSSRYVAWREQLLAGSRLLGIAALCALQLGLPGGGGVPGQAALPLALPFVALAQLTGIACMQVRLATFVPCQVAHLLVLLARAHPARPLLHFVQLFGGGLCLPCVLLHAMECHSRRAFLAALVAPPPPPAPAKSV